MPPSNFFSLLSVSHDPVGRSDDSLVNLRFVGRAGIYEEWIPGCHYDLGRQRFRFWRSGGPLVERILSAISYVSFIGDGRTIEPNLVLSDLALWKMLQQVALHDAGGLLLPLPPLGALAGLGITILARGPGSGDVYGNIAQYGPFGARFGRWAAQVLGRLAVWTALFDLRDRMISLNNATGELVSRHPRQQRGGLWNLQGAEERGGLLLGNGVKGGLDDTLKPTLQI